MNYFKRTIDKFFGTKFNEPDHIGSSEIKAIRKQYNLSQRSFAAMLDINLRTLQDYELGRIKPSKTAISLFNLAKNEMKTFLKYREIEHRNFER
jgi:DNA-binding transcriptional regulator YiaG